MSLSEPSTVVGWQFPGGEFTIDAAENESICRVLGVAPATDGTAHPMYAYVAAQRAQGIGVGPLIEMFGGSVDGGAMLGTLRLEWLGPLQVGHTYRVSGEVLSVTRKQSKTLGAFDLAEFELRLHDGDRRLTGSRTTFVIPIGADQ